MPQPNSKFIKANGINHHYLDWGNPSLQTVIMVHATGLCAAVWKPIATKPSQTKHVMAFDQRGHGDSDQSDSGDSFELIGEDLASIIEALGESPVFVVGHSSGGIATLIADHLLSGQIAKAILVETRILDGQGSGGALKKRADRTRMKRAIWENRSTMYEAYRPRDTFKNWTEECLISFIESGTKLLPDGKVKLKCSPEIEASFYEQRENLVLSNYFKGLTAEYKILLGDYPEAQQIDDNELVYFLNNIPDSSVKPMQIGSHFLPLEHPQIVFEEIEGFFRPATGNTHSMEYNS